MHKPLSNRSIKAMVTYFQTMAIFMLMMTGLSLTSLAERIDDMCFPCVCVSSDERGLYKVDCRSKKNLEGRLPQFTKINDSQIRSLNMSGTSLSYLKEQTQTPFENYSSLQELDVYNTSINLLRNNNSTVTSETFKGLASLEVLNIAHNDFPVTSETDSYVFVRLPSLKKLFMYQIKLISSGDTTYPGQILKNISTLEEVWFDEFSVVWKRVSEYAKLKSHSKIRGRNQANMAVQRLL